MKNNLNLYYDEEGDFLEIHIGNYGKGTFKNLGNGIFERIDENNNITGIAVMGFKKRINGSKKLKLPVSMQFFEA
ncbi:DUF2283 domain-containing protein [Candidatus Woesearchaeota archaeon]|nr:MAG: DUF2283 domain-containing protein [Candidatus Woesearchaeota archaeon]